MIKLRLQLLYSFGLGLKNQRVFGGWEGNEIGWSIVVWNTIKVVNMPTLWQRFIVSSFPNNHMLKYISAFVCPWMTRAHKEDVSSPSSHPTSLPTISPFSSWVNSMLPTIEETKVNGNPTYGAGVLVLLSVLASIFSQIFLVIPIHFFTSIHIIPYNYKLDKLGDKFLPKTFDEPEGIITV